VGDLLLVLPSGETRTLLHQRLMYAGLAPTHESTHPQVLLSLPCNGPLGDSAPVRTECCHEPPNLAQLPDIWIGQARMGGKRGQALLGYFQSNSDPDEGRFSRPSHRLWCAHQAPEGYHGSALFSATRWARAVLPAKNALALHVAISKSSKVRRPVRHSRSRDRAGLGRLRYL
jgi:hypothetical protein